MNNKKYIGIDIGGTSAKVAVVYEDGSYHMCDSFATGVSMNRKDLFKSILHVIDTEGSDNLCGVGISTLGIVNKHTSLITSGVPNLPCLDGVNLVYELAQHHPSLNVVVTNDAAAAALGEKWRGAAQGVDDYFCMTLGTGVGGCLVLGGRPVRGAHSRAGEIGYYDYESESDYLETRYSTQMMMDHVSHKTGMPNLTGITFFERVNNNDPVFVAHFEAWMERLARILANIIIIADVEKIIIGGGVSGEPLLITSLRQYVEQMLPLAFRGQCEIVAAMCTNNAGVLGAVYALMQKN